MSNPSQPAINVKVFDGAQYVENRLCRVARTPIGEPGVVHRGLTHPLLPGNRIDLRGPAYVPAVEMSASTEPLTFGFTFIHGDQAGYLLVEGSVSHREAAAVALRAAGAVGLRSGRYLGDPLEALSPDWFIRFDNGGNAATSIANAVSQTLANTSISESSEQGAALRIRLLATELAEERARSAMLARENAQLCLARAEALASLDAADTAALEKLAIERAELASAVAEEERARIAAESLASETTAALPAAVTAPRSLLAEIECVFDALLPQVRLLRDSLLVATVEYRDRGALYRALAQLEPGMPRLPGKWKKLQGLDSWWERHVSNGASDAGRLYARLETQTRVFEVLASHKGEQARDINWLQRN